MSNKISRPILRIVIEGLGDEPDVEYIVQTDNRDAVRFDVMRAKKGWPNGDVAPILWMTVTGWSALERTKAITLKVDDFLARCVDCEPCDENGMPAGDAEAQAADPTQPGADTDSL